MSGKLSTGHNVKVGYLSQHAEELSAGTARTVVEATTHLTGLTPNKARALLGRFLFSGEEAEKPLDGLSGGERRRLSLAILVQSGANVLILDEPTNHLDLESREALELALRDFPGSLLLVSHDRALLDAVGTRTVAFEGPDDAGAAQSGEAGRRAGGEPPPCTATWAAGPSTYGCARSESGRSSRPRLPPSPRAAKPAQRCGRRQRRREEARAGDRGRRGGAARARGRARRPAAWTDPKRSARSTKRHQAAKRAVDELYERWERVAG